MPESGIRDRAAAREMVAEDRSGRNHHPENFSWVYPRSVAPGSDEPLPRPAQIALVLAAALSDARFDRKGA
jgi:hypothetical protein